MGKLKGDSINFSTSYLPSHETLNILLPLHSMRQIFMVKVKIITGVIMCDI